MLYVLFFQFALRKMAYFTIESLAKYNKFSLTPLANCEAFLYILLIVIGFFFFVCEHVFLKNQ